jgi:hypothetical protein
LNLVVAGLFGAVLVSGATAFNVGLWASPAQTYSGFSQPFGLESTVNMCSSVIEHDST